jgi:hypothetical protein
MSDISVVADAHASGLTSLVDTIDRVLSDGSGGLGGMSRSELAASLRAGDGHVMGAWTLLDGDFATNRMFASGHRISDQSLGGLRDAHLALGHIADDMTPTTRTGSLRSQLGRLPLLSGLRPAEGEFGLTRIQQRQLAWIRTDAANAAAALSGSRDAIPQAPAAIEEARRILPGDLADAGDTLASLDSFNLANVLTTQQEDARALIASGARLRDAAASGGPVDPALRDEVVHRIDDRLTAMAPDAQDYLERARDGTNQGMSGSYQRAIGQLNEIRDAITARAQ